MPHRSYIVMEGMNAVEAVEAERVQTVPPIPGYSWDGDVWPTIAEVKANAKAGCKVSQEALIRAGVMVRSNKPLSPPVPELYGYWPDGRPRRDIRPL